tara:strand:+ start:215 stop:1177 length:963 start_codon:yes stop_codon:yes gene_type:complete
VDARIIEDEPITIGRDRSSDWMIADSDNQISRIHCSVQNWNNRLVLTDTSSNGVFLKDGEKRISKNSPHSLESGQRFYLGSYFVEIALPPDEMVTDKTTIGVAETDPGQAKNAAKPPSTEPDLSKKAPDASLLAAFCRGARIDVSALVEEDSVAIMERAGSIYREVLAGMTQLINERAKSREMHCMDRTTIGSAENNPFKWAPGQNLSVDLLKESRDGFLQADKAIQACFKDVDAHMRATEIAVDGAVQGLLAAISPDIIGKDIDSGFNFKSRNAKCWEHYICVHDNLSGDPDNRRQTYDTSFRQSYNQALINNTDRTVI